MGSEKFPTIDNETFLKGYNGTIDYGGKELSLP